jgi:hypothetical protein
MDTNRKIYRRRRLHGLTSSEPIFAPIGDDSFRLSSMLFSLAIQNFDRLILCGSLGQMSREYVEEPLSEGWQFDRKYIHKYRSPVYRSLHCDRPISVKLASESWFPGCEDVDTARAAWDALKVEWGSTGLPLMSTPATTGMALLWENLPKGEFPSLSEDLARFVRKITPQHRKEDFTASGAKNYRKIAPTHCYDGRFMYAAMTARDRYPVGEPRKTGGFKQYQPGFYYVSIKVPDTWARIGLIPVPDFDRVEQFGTLGWIYPNEPGQVIDQVWVAEPELTFAVQQGWELLEVHDGWIFDKGRPFEVWGKRLIEMRDKLQRTALRYLDGGIHVKNEYDYAAAAVRQVLTNTIGRIHKNTVERESIVDHDEWRELIRKWGYANVVTIEEPGESGLRLVEHPEPSPSDFMVFMPHWSATLYSLARVEVLKYALKIEREDLIEIDGDAVYTTKRQQWIEDQDKENGERIGQLRRKES